MEEKKMTNDNTHSTTINIEVDDGCTSYIDEIKSHLNYHQHEVDELMKILNKELNKTPKKGCKIQSKNKTFYCVDCRACLNPVECKKIREQIGSEMLEKGDKNDRK